MPLYSYRCTECMNMHDIRHDFDHVNKSRCGECGGELCKFYGNVVVAASCMPTRSFTDFDATRLKADCNKIGFIQQAEGQDGSKIGFV